MSNNFDQETKAFTYKDPCFQRRQVRVGKFNPVSPFADGLQYLRFFFDLPTEKVTFPDEWRANEKRLKKITIFISE
jgi:hypothetical protein